MTQEQNSAVVLSYSRPIHIKYSKNHFKVLLYIQTNNKYKIIPLYSEQNNDLNNSYYFINVSVNSKNDKINKSLTYMDIISNKTSSIDEKHLSYVKIKKRNYNIGDTTYGPDFRDMFDKVSDKDYIISIHDHGGRDVLDLRSYSGVAYINLNPGKLSWVIDETTDSQGHKVSRTISFVIKGNAVIEEVFSGFLSSAHIIGNDSDNFISGGLEVDLINGGGGNDNIYCLDGNDQVNGGAGNDYIYGQTGDDIIDAGEGDDYVECGLGDDTAFGCAGNDKIRGEEGDDILRGEVGDDTLLGGSGDDYLYGGQGDDCLEGADGDDVMSGGTGNDIIYVRGGRDLILYKNDAKIAIIRPLYDDRNQNAQSQQVSNVANFLVIRKVLYIKNTDIERSYVLYDRLASSISAKHQNKKQIKNDKNEVNSQFIDEKIAENSNPITLNLTPKKPNGNSMPLSLSGDFTVYLDEDNQLSFVGYYGSNQLDSAIKQNPVKYVAKIKIKQKYDKISLGFFSGALILQTTVKNKTATYLVNEIDQIFYSSDTAVQFAYNDEVDRESYSTFKYDLSYIMSVKGDIGGFL